MSQALQSLNSILKYKNERERQKIDRSLSMMDMATRLRQQQIDNTRQDRMMELRESDARRDIKESAARLTNLNLQQEKLKRDASDVSIEQENRLIEAQTKKAELDAEKAEFQLTNSYVDETKASLDNILTNQKKNLWEDTTSFLKGLEDAVEGSTMASQDFEESETNTVVKNYKKYTKTDAEKNLLKYITTNHRVLIPTMAAVNTVGFKTSENSVINNLAGLYQDIQKNTKLQKLFEEVGVSTDVLSSKMIELSNIIQQEKTYNTLIQSGELENQAKRLVKSRGLDADSQLVMFGLELLGVGQMSNEDIDTLNEERIRLGKDIIPYEEFR
tara:strand:- start:321 stop:1310 length:990 start_codon:yes stop_codon:yes gene_type:complete